MASTCRLVYYGFMYKRIIDLQSLVAKNSYFLFGPRTTGKTSLIKKQLSDAITFDLLESDTYDELQRRPQALADKILNSEKIVVIDEIQKLPRLLDEIHRLIEKKGTRFLLTGSSTRKLRKAGVNMLGGRAREAQLFPLVSAEISDFDLLKYLRFGGLPRVYQSQEPIEDLKAYARIYLNEEIKMEAAVRNYDRFVRFMETMALSNGQEINYAALSSDSGVPARTIEGHIEVLKDTLIGFELMPFNKTIKRKAITKSKFYFFDCGVANYFSGRLPLAENSSDLGVSFEQFMILEVRAYLSYNKMNKSMTYWRTRDFEVDLIIGNEVAIEFKFSKLFKPEFLKGLHALKEERLLKKFYLVGRFQSSGQHQDIEYFNYADFLKKLWSGQII